MTEARKFARAVDAEGNTVMEFIGPGRSDDALSVILRILTHQLKLRAPEADHSGGFFGGEFGYGVKYENDTFLMHPYCWCERDDCPWCGGCRCPADTWDYFIDGEQVTYEQHHALYQRHLYDRPIEQNKKQRDEDYRQLGRASTTKPRASCDYCIGRGVFARFGGQAPNFWHKPSGLKVRWYKYIGRDMEADGGDDSMTAVDLLASCLASIGAGTVEECIEAYQRAEDESAERAEKEFEFWASDEGRELMQKMEDDGVIKTFVFGKPEPPDA